METIAHVQVMEDRLLAAMLSSDVDELDRLIGDQALVSGTDGQLTTKADDIAAHQTGLLRLRTMTPQRTTIQLITPDVAIAFALISLEGTYRDQAFAGLFRYTRVWHNTDERWQIVAAHISALPQ